MLLNHINDAIKKLCPYGKTTCLLWPGCSVIAYWVAAHRSPAQTVEFIAINNDKLREHGRKGGLTKASRARGEY